MLIQHLVGDCTGIVCPKLREQISDLFQVGFLSGVEVMGQNGTQTVDKSCLGSKLPTSKWTVQSLQTINLWLVGASILTHTQMDLDKDTIATAYLCCPKYFAQLLPDPSVRSQSPIGRKHLHGSN